MYKTSELLRFFFPFFSPKTWLTKKKVNHSSNIFCGNWYVNHSSVFPVNIHSNWFLKIKNVISYNQAKRFYFYLCLWWIDFGRVQGSTQPLSYIPPQQSMGENKTKYLVVHNKKRKITKTPKTKQTWGNLI